MKREHLYKGYKIVTFLSGRWWLIYNTLGHRVGGDYCSVEDAKAYIDRFG